MSTQTSRLKLLEPELTENWSVQDHFNANMEKIESAVVRTTSNNITGVSGANNSAFIVNLMQKLASIYDFSALQYGDVIAGRAEWAGVDYVHFTVTKVTGTTWNVFITASSRIVTGYYNTSNGTVTGVNDVISKTIYNGTVNSNYISALEGKVIKNGSFVSGYFVLTASTDFSAANLTLISNLPAAYNQDVQLPCIGLSGTNIYKASRVRITTSGTITTWYGLSFKSGESYLITVNYICA